MTTSKRCVSPPPLRDSNSRFTGGYTGCRCLWLPSAHGESTRAIGHARSWRLFVSSCEWLCLLRLLMLLLLLLSLDWVAGWRSSNWMGTTPVITVVVAVVVLIVVMMVVSTPSASASTSTASATPSAHISHALLDARVPQILIQFQALSLPNRSPSLPSTARFILRSLHISPDSSPGGPSHPDPEKARLISRVLFVSSRPPGGSMKAMGYNPYDSSGTDDDLPLTQNRGLRGRSFSGNGRASVGPFPYVRAHNDLESEIHRVEQEAYTGVLRAFKVQSDAISWEKESLITELRKELRVSDEEHRELLNKVNEDGSIRRMRELRQGGGTQSSLHHGSRVLHDAEPGLTAKRQKTSHLIPLQSAGLQSPLMPSHSVPSSAKWGPSSTKAKKAKMTTPLALPSVDPTSLIHRNFFTRWPEDNNFYEATITNYNPATGEHALVYDKGTMAETWESVRLSDMAPEDIRWDCDDQGISKRDGWGPSGPVLKRHPSNNGTMALSGRGRGRLSQNEPIKDYAPPQNGINRNIGHIDVPNIDSVVIEVERVLSNPNMREIEKARKLLKDQEQSLLDAIARLDEASDSESEDMATEGRMGSAGDHMGRNGSAC